jgi:hypothetical protein
MRSAPFAHTQGPTQLTQWTSLISRALVVLRAAGRGPEMSRSDSSIWFTRPVERLDSDLRGRLYTISSGQAETRRHGQKAQVSGVLASSSRPRLVSSRLVSSHAWDRGRGRGRVRGRERNQGYQDIREIEMD